MPPPPPTPPGWASCKFLLQAVGGGGVDFAGKIWLFAMRCNSSALFPDADSRAWLIWKGGGGLGVQPHTPQCPCSPYPPPHPFIHPLPLLWWGRREGGRGLPEGGFGGGGGVSPWVGAPRHPQLSPAVPLSVGTIPELLLLSAAPLSPGQPFQPPRGAPQPPTPAEERASFSAAGGGGG